MIKALKITLIVAGWLVIASLTSSYVELQKRIDAPVLFGVVPKVGVASWDQGFISFSGTFKYDREGIFYPKINMVDGHCIKQIEGCNLAIAVVDAAGSDPVLSVKTDSFNVTKWDKETVVFENSHPCYKTIFTVNRLTSTITGAEVFPGDKSGNCDKGSNVTITLINGHEQYQQLKNKSSVYGLLNLIGLAFSLIGALVLCWKIIRHKQQ